jgi:hypothetical protein
VTSRACVARLVLVAAVPWAAIRSAAAQVERRNVAQLPFADGVIVIDAHSDGRVVIGAAHGDSTAVVSLPAHAAQEWADSVAHLLAARVRATPRPRADRRVVDDPETGAGISFTRYALRGALRYRLFFSTARYGGFPFEVSRREAELLVNGVRRGVRVARAMAAPPPRRRRP